MSTKSQSQHHSVRILNRPEANQISWSEPSHQISEYLWFVTAPFKEINCNFLSIALFILLRDLQTLLSDVILWQLKMFLLIIYLLIVGVWPLSCCFFLLMMLSSQFQWNDLIEQSFLIKVLKSVWHRNPLSLLVGNNIPWTLLILSSSQSNLFISVKLFFFFLQNHIFSL